ncbi:HD domain-containing protein [Psychrobacter proteolyticus]|uniref:Metal-dependent HD superfamily phosphohydrolase n=1 Tax=Psychrobacter proteolyticus TaxID=147825 RepID=A0ABV0D6X5_9GAMM
MKTASNNHDELGKCFVQHLSAMTSDILPKQIDRLWQDIVTRYGEPQRAYHTLNHIEQLLVQFENIKHYLAEPHITALALYYHDVIYDPTRSDNELKSADFATDALSPYLSPEQCQQIYALIMMTANHQIDESIDSVKYSDAAYLLDMDLSILGAPWPTYKQYAKAIRQEYAHVADDNYRDGRTAVLQGLLAHPKLYLTDHYYNQLETQARDNINHELTLLAAL